MKKEKEIVAFVELGDGLILWCKATTKKELAEACDTIADTLNGLIMAAEVRHD